MIFGNNCRFWLGVMPILLMFGCSTMETMRDDPLIGKIFESEEQREVTYSDLVKKLEKQDIIYLGENHENSDHHRIQLQVITELVQLGKKPRIGFELFSRDQTGYLMTFVGSKRKHKQESQKKAEENRLRKDLGWQDRKETTWGFYFDLIALARKHELSVFGADLPKGVVRRLMRQGIAQLTPVEKEMLKSSELKDPEYQALMVEKFKAAHCGFAHKGMTEKMYQTWLERNDAMAASIVETFKSDPEQPVVMIVGSGHVEHNMGIYERVSDQLKTVRQLNIGLKEIAIKPLGLSDYFAPGKAGKRTFLPKHELLWFTQRTSYQDPCVKFRKAFKTMKLKKMKKSPPS